MDEPMEEALRVGLDSAVDALVHSVKDGYAPLTLMMQDRGVHICYNQQECFPMCIPCIPVHTMYTPNVQ